MSEGLSPETSRERVYEAFADRQQPLSTAIRTALETGARRLDVELGFVTRIDDETQYIEHAVGDHDEVRPGSTCPLDRAYCRGTIELEGKLSVQDASASTDVSQRAYETFGLGSYIGCTVVVDGDVYGTVCFADTDSRATPFTESDELFVELLARLVGHGIERREYEAERADRTAELEAEKRRFEGIAETSFDVIFRVDDAGRFTYVSQAVERVLGYGPEELVGDEFARYLSDESLPAAAEAFEDVTNGETITGLELTFRDSDGDEAYIEVNATPVDSDSAAVQGVGRDVTERNAREAELRVKTRAMDAAAMPITIADATADDNPIVYVNEAFEVVTGYGREYMEGRNCRILQGRGTDPEHVATLRAGIEADEMVSVELLNYRRDGSPFWNNVTVTPVRDDSGTVTHYLGFQQDVTERTRTERLVELLNRVLRHNLRNELTVIEGHADFINEPPAELDVEAGIRRPLNRLLTLSNSARELEKYAKQERVPRRIDVEDAIETVVAEKRTEFPEATVTVSVETDRDVVAGRELSRALDELVTNALVHGGDGGVTVEITVRDGGDDSLEVVVTDDGPGIPAMEAAVVADGRETTLEHGKGLGLWLVNWIVTRYGGSFQIAGGDGTVATVQLPAIGPGQSVDDAARRPTTLFR